MSHAKRIEYQLEDRASIEDLGRTERIVPRPAPIGAAVVGYGYWGPNLARNLEERGEFSLEFLCDRDHDAACEVLCTASRRCAPRPI